MILYRDWTITSDGLLARQYDNLSRRVDVVGELPPGWTWDLMVQVGNAMDIIPLEPMEGGVGHTLTAEQVSIDGYYTVQLRGRSGDVIKHTNTTQCFVSKSLSGTAQWPSIPSEFAELEQRMWELNNHPPVPGEKGFWLIWNPVEDRYEESAFPLPDDVHINNPYAVEYKPQTLTAAEQEQARTNINALGKDELPAAVDDALAKAKESGEFDGAPGPAGRDGQDGRDGAEGKPGADGVGVKSIEQTTTSTADGGSNVITATLTNGVKTTFTVRNGSKGSQGAPGKDGRDGQDGVGIGRPGTGIGAEIFNYESNVASGQYAHAEGVRAVASGDCSHAEGADTMAIGYGSHTEGVYTYADGAYAHAEGCRTLARRRSQHAQGEYNIEDIFGDGASIRGKYVHIVGNGTSTSDRSNAHTLDWAGNAWFAGGVYVGGTGQDDPEAKRLATAEELRQLSEKIANIGSGVEPAEDDIPKVFFGAPLPQTKDETVMSFRYISKTMDVSGYCKTKAQGNSSLNYPKKNQTVKLYKDAECTEKLKIAFGNWGEQNKFCFKANWIDLTHARNIVSARLWGDVVKSRSDYAELPELLRTSPNEGAVNGFPIKLYADGVYQGRYTINIPKDAWMANMDDSLDTHCILCGENYVSGCFRAAANIDETDWTDEIHDTVPASIKTRWNEVISFVMNSTDEEFAANLGNYFDIPSLIDYYLFGIASCGLDAFGKNQLYMTYDGQKWIATMYDMDATWGLWWNGAYFVATNYARNEFQDFKDGDGNLLYIRLEAIFKDQIKARWVELRSGALSESNIINRFERFTDICPPWLVEEDYAATTADGAFTAIPSQTTNNIQQIRGYIVDRMAYADEEIPNIGSLDKGIVYALPTATTFDGVDDYIDTGIALWQEGEYYTIFADLTSDESAATLNTAFCCMDENGGNGFMMFTADIPLGRSLVNAGKAINNYTAYQGTIAIPNGTRGKVCIRFSGKTLTDIFWKRDGANSESRSFENPPEITLSRKLTLLLGCAYSTAYEPWRFWPGTMHDFRVWNRLLTDAEIASLL